jgi:UDP-N-acetylglucosamine 2-epimerase (non-hydrolysing)
MNKTKVTTILGTRPELIRLSTLIEKFDEVFDHRLIHTGQNSDYKLSEIFFNELDIRKPDKVIETNSESLGSFLGKLLPEIEREFDEFFPDAVVILGDTNSAMSGLIAKKRGIPIYHLEAGNRSYDPNVPEESNRKVIDHFADFNLTYTLNSKENLIREGVHPRYLTVIGSPLYEVFSRFKNEINNSEIISQLGLNNRNYFLLSIHRQENVNHPERLTTLVDALNALAVAYQIPIIVSTHPRTKSKLNQLKVRSHSLVKFEEPFGFFSYNKLQKESRIVISDSGSLAEESVILGFQAITIRDSIERPEALESGSIIMSGMSTEGLLESIFILENGGKATNPPSEYLIEDTSNRVIRYITSTVRQYKFWTGLRENSN